MKNIEAIIFDLGGVIINIDFNLTLRALEQYTHIRLGEGEYLGKDALFYDFEVGKIDEDTFFEQLSRKFELKADKNTLIDAWNALLLDIPQQRVSLLRKLRSQMPIFILSNTNSTHIREVENILRSQTDAQNLSDLVQKPYYSFEMGKAKPEKAIYEQLIEECNLIPQKTLFIDDSLKNLEGAKQVHLQTLHINPHTQSIMNFFSL
ncbi:MAG: HAD family phosphatase [Thermonemataceae bacterium]|nr:HAD family phosphatase [Thermonemataceae bacterium]